MEKQFSNFQDIIACNDCIFPALNLVIFSLWLRRPRSSEEMDGKLKIDLVKFSQLSAMPYSELYIKHQKFLCTQIDPILQYFCLIFLSDPPYLKIS